MPDVMNMDLQVDEALKEAADKNGLTFRLFKTDRDDPNMAKILKIAGGYVSGNKSTLSLPFGASTPPR